MKAKLMLAGIAAVALMVAVARFKPLPPIGQLDDYLDYEEWPLFQ